MATRRQIKRRHKKAITEPKSKYHGNTHYDTKEEKNIFRSALPMVITVLVFTLAINFGPTLGVQAWNNAIDNLNKQDNSVTRTVANVMTTTGDKIAETYNNVMLTLEDLKSDSTTKAPTKVEGQTGEPGSYTVVDRVDTTKDPNILTIADMPAYTGSTEILELNNNKSAFSATDLTVKGNQTFSALDKLGRPGQANALLTPAMQPTDARESISSVTPPGWKDGKTSNNQRVVLQQGRKAQWFYDRSHLIGFQLGGVNAEAANLVTGARTFNDPNMKIYETVVDNAIEEGYSVRYQVTPIYNNQELVPRGVQMRAYSIEDKGKKVDYNVFIYNVNPGYKINYQNGTIE